MQRFIIANPHSGRGRGRDVLARVQKDFHERGVEFETALTTGPLDAREFARAAAARDVETVVVIGGDGTLHEALGGLMEGPRRPRLAQIPVGTGNSFIKDLGIESLEDGLRALAEGKTRRVDLGRGKSSGGEFWFINLAGAGFVARAARRAVGFKKLGNLSYVLAVLLELPGLKPRRLRVVADGIVTEREALFIEICNSRKTGGDMIMAPRAEVDDGLFDVVIAKAMGRREVLGLFPQIFSGRHIESPLIEYFTCASVEAAFDSPEPVTPDGELFGSTPLTAAIHPAALEVYCL
jgi:diacylglycerol kinase (ATP)